MWDVMCTVLVAHNVTRVCVVANLKTKNIMEELKVLYKELQERQKHLESRKKTKITEGRIAENLLTMVRLQQLLIPLVVGRSEQLSKVKDGECCLCGDVAESGWVCEDCKKL